MVANKIRTPRDEESVREFAGRHALDIAAVDPVRPGRRRPTSAGSRSWSTGPRRRASPLSRGWPIGCSRRPDGLSARDLIGRPSGVFVSASPAVQRIVDGVADEVEARGQPGRSPRPGTSPSTTRLAGSAARCWRGIPSSRRRDRPGRGTTARPRAGSRSAAFTEATTMAAGSTPGRISRHRIRDRARRGRARRRRTRRLAGDRTSARTTRAISGHDVSPSSRTSRSSPGPNSAITTTARKKRGTTWTNSVSRMSTSSTARRASPRWCRRRRPGAPRARSPRQATRRATSACRGRRRRRDRARDRPCP